MNNIVKIVEYYVNHNNADDSVVQYIKEKLDNCTIEDLIIIQIELLFTDPSDNLVSGLVNYITNKINEILSEMKLSDLANTISLLEVRKKEIELQNNKLDIENKNIFEDISNKDLEKHKENNEFDDTCVARLVNKTQDNLFYIDRNKNEMKSVDIWLNNLINSYNRQINNSDIKELLECYIEELDIFDRDEFINNYINIVSSKIDNIIMKTNLLDAITNVMPELDKLYKESYKTNDNIFKILDYYIDLLDINIKKKINNLEYEEKIILKEKINLISKDILSNETEEDDFKALVMNSYLKYL